MKPRSSRWSALAVGAIAASALAMPGAAHAAAPSPTSALGRAQGWLQSQLVDGMLQYSSYPAPNVGATIDTATSFLAVDPSADVSAEVAGLKAHLAGYTDDDEYACPTPGDYSCDPATMVLVQHGYYANGTAKALAFAETVHADATSFGGKNLVTQLESRVQASGRIQDDSSYGDYANVFGQAFAVAGLTAAGSSKAASATTFLLSQQCANGSFPEQFDHDATTFAATDKTCAQAPRTGSVDATATVILELHGLPGTDQAIANAGQWLLSKQAPDGGWTDGDKAPENVDSTGLASRALHWLALHSVSNDMPAAKGASWIANHQLLDLGSCKGYPGADAGALAYDDKALADTSGGTATDTYRVAASQALPALAYAPAVSVTTPAFAPAGSSVTLAVSGQPVCLDGTLVPAGKTLTRTLPATTGSITFLYAAVGSVGSVKVTALAAERLPVVARSTVHRNRALRLVISGLAPGESVTARLRTVHAHATANADGVAVVRVKAKGKPGRTKVVVAGEFANRHGSVRVRILR